MNKLFHYLILIYENKISVVSVFVLMLSVTIAFVFGLASHNSFNEFIDTTEKLGLDKAIKVEPLKSELSINDFSDLDYFDKVYFARHSFFLGIDSINYIQTWNYSYGNDNNIIPVKLDTGEYCKTLSSNEVLLSSSLNDRYQINEVVSFEVRWRNDEGGTYYYKDVPFLIVGFVDDEQLIVSGGHKRWPQDITSYYHMFNEDFAICGSFNSDGLTVYEDVYDNETVDPKVHSVAVNASVPFDEKLWFVLVFPTGKTGPEMMKELDKRFPGTRLYEYETLRKNFIENESLEFFMIRSLLFVSGVTSLIVTVSSMILCSLKRRSDLAVFYMLGGTWRYSLISMLSTHFSGLLFGIVLGCIIGRKLAFNTYGEKYTPGLGICLIFSVSIVLFYMMIVLTFYLFHKSRTPSELYRKFVL